MKKQDSNEKPHNDATLKGKQHEKIVVDATYDELLDMAFSTPVKKKQKKETAHKDKKSLAFLIFELGLIYQPVTYVNALLIIASVLAWFISRDI